jgi:hypothetical protein
MILALRIILTTMMMMIYTIIKGTRSRIGYLMGNSENFTNLST